MIYGVEHPCLPCRSRILSTQMSSCSKTGPRSRRSRAKPENIGVSMNEQSGFKIRKIGTNENGLQCSKQSWLYSSQQSSSVHSGSLAGSNIRHCFLLFQKCHWDCWADHCSFAWLCKAVFRFELIVFKSTAVWISTQGSRIVQIYQVIRWSWVCDVVSSVSYQLFYV